MDRKSHLTTDKNVLKCRVRLSQERCHPSKFVRVISIGYLV